MRLNYHKENLKYQQVNCRNWKNIVFRMKKKKSERNEEKCRMKKSATKEQKKIRKQRKKGERKKSETNKILRIKKMSKSGTRIRNK